MFQAFFERNQSSFIHGEILTIAFFLPWLTLRYLCPRGHSLATHPLPCPPPPPSHTMRRPREKGSKRAAPDPQYWLKSAEIPLHAQNKTSRQGVQISSAKTRIAVFALKKTDNLTESLSFVYAWFLHRKKLIIRDPSDGRCLSSTLIGR